MYTVLFVFISVLQEKRCQRWGIYGWVVRCTSGYIPGLLPFSFSNGKHPAASQTHADVNSTFIKFILINFNDDFVFFTEEANSLKKLSIELPSKIPLLNPTAILVPLPKPVATLNQISPLSDCRKHVGDMFICRYSCVFELAFQQKNVKMFKISLLTHNHKILIRLLYVD